MQCLTNFSRRTKLAASCVGLILVATSIIMKWVVVPPVVNSVVWSYMKLMDGTLGYDVSRGQRCD